MQLREPELICAVDDERVRVGDIQPGFDDGRRDQHVGAALPEVDHHLLEVGLAHLTVGNSDASLGHELLDLRRDAVDRRHPVVHIEDLPLAQQLAANGRGDLPVAIGADEGENRVPVFWRGGEGAHLANTRHRHLERARNRGRGHRQNVDVCLQFLEGILVLDAEALLLIDDHQAQVFEHDVRAEQAVSADDDVDRAVCHAHESLFRLLLALESG